MKTLLEIFQFVFSLGAIFLFFVGLFYPKLIIKKPFTGRRLLLVFISIVLLAPSGFIQEYKVNYVYSPEEREQYYADIHKQDSIKAVKNGNTNFVESKTIVILSDSTIFLTYKPEFDSLYNKLISIDKGEEPNNNRSDYHKQIQNLLFKRWWTAMENVDSTHASLPL